MLEKRSVAYDVIVTFHFPHDTLRKKKRILTFHKKVDLVGTMNKTSTNNFTIDWLDFRI